MGRFILKKNNTMQSHKGTVKFFNTQKGFGFIQGDDGQDYFAHFSAIQMEGHKSLANDEPVEFSIEEDPRTGKIRAINITGPGGAPPQGQPQQDDFHQGGRGGFGGGGRGGYNNGGGRGGYNNGGGRGGYSQGGRGGYNSNFSGDYDNSR